LSTTGFFCSWTMDHGLSVSGRTSVRVGAELYMGVVSKRDRPGGVAPGRSGIVDPMSARASRDIDALVDIPLSLEAVRSMPHQWSPGDAGSVVHVRLPQRVLGRGTGRGGCLRPGSERDRRHRDVGHGDRARAGRPIDACLPARLLLVCSPCLRTGSIVDPVTVVPTSPLLPLCDRHWRSQGEGHLSARAVEADLLANYGVELLPRPPLPRHRLPFAGRRSWRTLGKVLTSIRHRAADPIPGRTVRSSHPYVGDA
jgi:hypothetical protein